MLLQLNIKTRASVVDGVEAITFHAGHHSLSMEDIAASTPVPAELISAGSYKLTLPELGRITIYVKHTVSNSDGVIFSVSEPIHVNTDFVNGGVTLGEGVLFGDHTTGVLGIISNAQRQLIADQLAGACTWAINYNPEVTDYRLRVDGVDYFTFHFNESLSTAHTTAIPELTHSPETPRWVFLNGKRYRTFMKNESIFLPIYNHLRKLQTYVSDVSMWKVATGEVWESSYYNTRGFYSINLFTKQIEENGSKKESLGILFVEDPV